MAYSVDMYIFKDANFIKKQNLALCEDERAAKSVFDSVALQYKFKKHDKIILDDPLMDTAYGSINGYDVELDMSKLKMENLVNIDSVFKTVDNVKKLKSCYLISKIICIGKDISYKSEYFATSLDEVLNMMDILEVDKHLVVATPPFNIINRFRTRKENVPNGAIYYVAHRVDHKE